MAIRRPDGKREKLDLTSAEIKVLSGQEILEHVGDEDLFRLMNVLRKATYDKPKMVAQGVRMRLKDALGAAGDCIGKFSTRGLHMLRSAADRVYQPPTQNEETKFAFEQLRRNIAEGNTFVLTVNGRVASTASIEKYRYQLKDGRDLWAVVKVATLPEFHGNGLGHKVAEKAQEAIQARYPGAPMWMITKTPAMKTIGRKLGWKELSSREVNEHTNRGETKMREGGIDEAGMEKLHEAWGQEGYCAFLSDPREQATGL